ncbi:MAG TPA: glycosyltransferase family 39 protein [Vicinamibacterales bacterium]|nr:glycosyltransferase family 39 protein [Vicinamibacterales bacterium]
MSKGIAILIAAGLAAFGIARGTWAVGGSDSSCYALTAQAFAAGEAQPFSAIGIDAPWPDASTTTAPGGFIPSPVRPGAASPICAPGFSLLMAPLAALFGQDAIFWLTPIAGAVLVLASFAIAHRLAGSTAGVTSALLVASSPIVLFQVVQPMNDVTTAALWMWVFALLVTDDDPDRLGRSRLAGFLAGLAILVRPNLAPLAIMAIALVLARDETRGRRNNSAGALVIGAIFGVAMMLSLNRALYGRVLGSGYGDVGSLFSLSHVVDNARNFWRALFATQHVVPALGLLAPVIFVGGRRTVAIVLLATAAMTTGIYLLYRPYPEWWYLRFLMPALVIMLVLASAVAVELASRARMRGVIPILAVLLAIVSTRAAGARDVFALQGLEGRYRDTAMVARERLPADAVFLTVWQSGSIRFHAGREIVMWDSLDPEWLDRAVAWLEQRGRRPYLLLERREEGEFRNRFRGHASIGALDWPPRFVINRQVRIFDPSDRARYLAGETYSTENISRPR